MGDDLALLAIQMDLLWQRDERGRLADNRRWPGYVAPHRLTHLVIARSNREQTVAIGSEVPDETARELQALVGADKPSPDPSRRPTPMNWCKELLAEALGAVEERESPVYVIPAGISVPPSTNILLSGDDVEVPAKLPPGDSGWTHDEWKLLLAGSFGPWAFAVVDGRVVSICHTPVPLSDRAAEAGVWTHPDFRGQGYAAAVTAAWASMLEPSGRHLFYSTTADNISSQRVAERLGLRLIGWQRQISTTSRD